MCRTVVGATLAASLEPLDHRRNIVSEVFYIGITLVDIRLTWLNWLLILVGGPLVILVEVPLVILIDCMIFLLAFLNDIRMSMSIVSSLAQLDSGIPCPQNVFF